MNSYTIVRSEVTNYLILTTQLKDQFNDIDEETLMDTLEGASALPDAIAAVIRSSLDDAALIDALKIRLEDLHLRLERFKDRYEKKRALARWGMLEAGLEKIQASDLSVGLRKGTERLEIQDESLIPHDYFVPQPPKLDRKNLLDAVKRGTAIQGVKLITGDTSLQVRVR